MNVNRPFAFRVSQYASCCGTRIIHGFYQRWDEGSQKELPSNLDSLILTAITNEEQRFTHSWLKKNGFKVIKKQKSGTTGALLYFWFRPPKTKFQDWA